jgi:hypothetical protein
MSGGSSMSSAPARRRPAAVAVAGVGLLASLVACSSPPSPAAQEQASRAPVLPVARQFRAQVTSAGVGWTAEILGDYEECGSQDPLAAGRGDGKLQYTASELLTPYDQTETYATFARQFVESVDAAGWKLRKGSGADPETQARYYVAQRGGVDLWVIELDARPGLGPEADVHLSSSTCFDAGSSAETIMTRGHQDQVKEPRPTATPTAKFP